MPGLRGQALRVRALDSSGCRFGQLDVVHPQAKLQSSNLNAGGFFLQKAQERGYPSSVQSVISPADRNVMVLVSKAVRCVHIVYVNPKSLLLCRSSALSVGHSD